MNSIRCRCGVSEMAFHHLRPQDMPEGWECEQCEIKKAMEADALEMAVLQGIVAEDGKVLEAPEEEKPSEEPKKKGKKK